MSLLIKALANAEKDKLAEANKPSTGEYVVDDALTFELEPVKQTQAQEIDELTKFVEETASTNYDVGFDFVVHGEDADEGLSLEQEAGLELTPTAPSQPTPKSQADTIKDTPKPNKPVETNSSAKAPQTAAATQKAAAKVFVANQSAKAPASKMALALLGLAGALIIWLGLQGYTYLQALTTPKVIIAKPPLQLPAPQAAAPTVTADATVTTNTEASPGVATTASAEADTGGTAQSAEPKSTGADLASKATAKIDSDNTPTTAEPDMPKPAAAKKPASSLTAADIDYHPGQKRAPLKLVSRAPSTGIDPTLLSAYQAYTRGEDAAAQQQYRQVLQRDVRNTDALLGMAAIAQRQSRYADAMGWYQKVLEIEPRNIIAQSAIASPQAGTDATATESRIKNMLAQQPEAANLHAALGNLYAEDNQWSLAQDAYFNASRYAPNNADYAFNLAVSLDQLGKPGLALAQYQRALELINQSGATSPDKSILEARIQALK